MAQNVTWFQRQRQALLLMKYLARGDRQLQESKGVPHARAERHFNQRLKQLEDE